MKNSPLMKNNMIDFSSTQLIGQNPLNHERNDFEELVYHGDVVRCRRVPQYGRLMNKDDDTDSKQKKPSKEALRKQKDVKQCDGEGSPKSSSSKFAGKLIASDEPKQNNKQTSPRRRTSQTKSPSRKSIKEKIKLDPHGGVLIGQQILHILINF